MHGLNASKDALTEPYQPMSAIVWKSSVIFGIAVAMIVWSRAIRNIARQRETMRTTRASPVGYCGSSAAGGVDTDTATEGGRALSGRSRTRSSRDMPKSIRKLGMAGGIERTDKRSSSFPGSESYQEDVYRLPSI